MQTFPTRTSAIAEPNPRCRICGSATEFRGAKQGRFLRTKFLFYQCHRCGFLFVEPITSPAIYDDAYYQGRGADPLVNYEEEYNHYASTERCFEFEDCVKFVERHFVRQDSVAIPDSITWLDFGCGAGGLLKYLRNLKTLKCSGKLLPIHVVGHDVGTYSKRLEQCDGIEMISLRDLSQMPPDRFDVITCIEVIEHVADPKSVIQLLARNLKLGGLLILTTGNMSSPLARLSGIRFAYCVPEIHVSLLNPSLLNRLYRDAGLMPVRLEHKGTIKFRILKNLRRIPAGGILAHFVNLPLVVRIADFLFGVSAIPSAFKPAITR